MVNFLSEQGFPTPDLHLDLAFVRQARPPTSGGVDSALDKHWLPWMIQRTALKGAKCDTSELYFRNHFCNTARFFDWIVLINVHVQFVTDQSDAQIKMWFNSICQEFDPTLSITCTRDVGCCRWWLISEVDTWEPDEIAAIVIKRRLRCGEVACRLLLLVTSNGYLIDVRSSPYKVTRMEVVVHLQRFQYPLQQ